VVNLKEILFRQPPFKSYPPKDTSGNLSIYSSISIFLHYWAGRERAKLSTIEPKQNGLKKSRNQKQGEYTMSAQNVESTGTKTSGKHSLSAGLILVGIGLGLLAFQVFGLQILFPLVLGAIFLAAGIVTRKAGLIIPGGIISGAGLGTLATVQGWYFPTNSEQAGGLFLLLFSLGWFSITLLSKLFTSETQTWALIPGAILAAIGGLVLMGERGISILELVGTYWPLILVAIGASILIGWWKERK
jgi:hypothetical protein